jgi:uncharacterized damage-inducible protein DinB
MKKILAAVCMLALPTTALGQQAAAANGGVQAAHAVWLQFTHYVAQAAADMPEADYGYSPTAGVRTFGQLIGHVAGAQRMFCALALGETPPAENAVEQAATSKAALIQALNESTEYCHRAYAQSDAAAAATITMFGQQQTRMFALSLNGAHNAEHYGNIVTYFRMKGMVPPSSRPQS